MSAITYRPIGVVHSPFKEPKNVPIQAAASKGTKGTIKVDPEYIEGLTDLEGFAHYSALPFQSCERLLVDGETVSGR